MTKDGRVGGEIDTATVVVTANDREPRTAP